MFSGIFLLLLLSGGASSERNCSYQDVLDHLNLTKRSSLFSMNRPVKNYKVPTKVSLDLLLYAILEVQEKDQKFVPYVWITMWWKNDFIGWKPEDFCGIEYLSIPHELLWQPDITIVEMTERDKAPPSPYLTITSNGAVELVNDQVLTSTCRMHIYKFPFDTQRCNLTFKSFIHADNELELDYYLTSSQVTQDSREVMRMQSEWLFINITVASEKEVNFNRFNQTLVIYTIHMKRRSALYIVNFLLPILFLLCLDLSSFMISESSGEKLGFKVTVLLAVTVMQLILNEILPSSSDKIPLIAVYCIGIFSLMMLSLMETVLVMYLMEKDSAPSDDKQDSKEQFHSGRDVFPADSRERENGGSRLTGEGQLSEKLLKEMQELTLFLKSRDGEGKPGNWTRAAQRINKAFCVCYIIAAALFLTYMFVQWNKEMDL